MREIKLQLEIEHPTEGKQIMINSLFDIQNGLVHHELGPNWKINWYRQYTGKEDRNGIEIFEGDKLRDPDDEGYLLIVWNSEKAKFEVQQWGYHMYFNEGGGEEFNNELSCIDTESVYMEDIYLYEVIGNIYQKSQQP